MDSSAQLVKDRLNIVDVVGGYVQLKKAGRNYTAHCPFHKERTPSFMVSPERGTYMCFGCGEKGDMFSFVEKMDGIDFKTALQQLAERAGVQLPTFKPRAPEVKEKDDRLRKACEAAAAFFEEQLKGRTNVQDYIRTRGVKDDTRAHWRIGYAPASWEDLSKHLEKQGFSKAEIVDAGLAAKSEKKQGEIYDRFRGRIMFPLFDIAGKIIAFSGRFFEKVEGSREEGEPAKYVNSPETLLFKKSRMLYGFNFARDSIRKADCILLVEGQFDVVLCHQSGLPFSVAVSGTALTHEHLTLLGRLSKRLVLALDNDEAGIRAGIKSAMMALGAGFDVKIPKIEGGKDPADLAVKNLELLKAAVRGSQPAVEFFLDALRPGARHHTNMVGVVARDERGYKKIVEREVLPLVAAMESKIDQAHFVHIIAERLRIPESAVQQEIAKVRRPLSTSERTETASESVSLPHVEPFEKAAAMLLAHFGKTSPTAQKLSELLGNERVAAIEQRIENETERFRFEFDLLGEDEEATAGMLLQSVERSALEEEIAAARQELHAADRARESVRAAEVTKRIVSLTRRKDGLRE